MDIQIVEWTRTETFPGAPTSSVQRTYYTLQDNVVMTRSLFPQPDGNWDTLYVLGDPGDRWWPRYADQSCPPLGMLEIQDTGHVTIQGLSLRTWNLAYLDENGEPIPQLAWFADTIGIIEHIGSMPGAPPMPCSVQTWDICSVYRLHYSDNLISIPDGTYCDITTEAEDEQEQPRVGVSPNPGIDQFMITGLTNNAAIDVRDPLGRLVNSRSKLPMNAPIETSSWASGTYFITVTQNGISPRTLRWVKQ